MCKIAGIVFAKATTQTVTKIAEEYKGLRISDGYVFPDGSLVRVDALSIGYCASDLRDYPAV